MRNTGSRARILERLQNGGWVRGRELHEIACPQSSMIAVRQAVHDLRAKGHDIEGDHVGPKSRGYRLIASTPA